MDIYIYNVYNVYIYIYIMYAHIYIYTYVHYIYIYIHITCVDKTEHVRLSDLEDFMASGCKDSGPPKGVCVCVVLFRLRFRV